MILLWINTYQLYIKIWNKGTIMINSIKSIYKKIIPENIQKAILFIRRFIRKIIMSIYLNIRYNIIRSSFPHYLSIVAIIKNEGPYIAEWLEYHLIAGVTKFYIYDNESEDNLKEKLRPYIESGIVEYKYFPGYGMQQSAYNDILKKARRETYWLAVIDCDEFIVPISTQTVPEFLKEFEGYGGVEINWLLYGSSGKRHKEDGLVIERFKDHSLMDTEDNYNRIVKTISNPRFVIYIYTHDAKYIFAKYSVNSNKVKLKKNYNYREGALRMAHDKIRINHYETKSYEEYLLKLKRGRATQKSEELRFWPIEKFNYIDRNDIKNDPIMDKYIPIIYKNLEQRYNND